jgi:2-iminobutanoate/2-iminopropanoate deaminase
LEDRVTKQPIAVPGSPPPQGAYSPGIQAGDTVYCSGQLGLDPATGELVDGGIAAQVEQALQNLGAVLGAAGLGLGDVVKTTCYLANISDFAAFNEAYGRLMPQPHPARTSFAVGALPRSGLIEIEAIAVRSRG